ncbi:MAG: hypothetical protein SGI92_01685 [Bryobacteraceae bacterium]|nr:hypothetical protein [Bryobacteraceae bacterium]
MSYLDSYGVREARRERHLKLGILAALLAVIAGVVIFFWLRDHSEKQQVAHFLAALKGGDYKSAYQFWGCSYEKPCREYPFDRFLEDWGPSSPQGNRAAARQSTGQHCKSGRIEVIQYHGREVQLWVERKTQLIGFAPWPIDTSQPANLTVRLRRIMHDLAGDCAPPPMKVP